MYTRWLNSDNAAIASKIRPFGTLVDLYTKSTASVTTATTTDVVPVPGAGKKNYVESGIVTNGGATGTWVKIIDDGTNILYTGYAAANGGGFIIPPGIFTTTEANMKIQMVTETAGCDVRCTLVGYIDYATNQF